jgi:hypothetical protein
VIAARLQLVSMARGFDWRFMSATNRSLRLDDEDLATAARSYSRQVRARLTCDVFVLLVAETVGSDPVQVMYR